MAGPGKTLCLHLSTNQFMSRVQNSFRDMRSLCVIKSNNDKNHCFLFLALMVNKSNYSSFSPSCFTNEYCPVIISEVTKPFKVNVKPIEFE